MLTERKRGLDIWSAEGRREQTLKGGEAVVPATVEKKDKRSNGKYIFEDVKKGSVKGCKPRRELRRKKEGNERGGGWTRLPKKIEDEEKEGVG